MNSLMVFDEHVAEYDEWYEKYPEVFKSEVEALRDMLPEGEALSGIEVGLGTGQFAKALGIKEGIEPSPNMRAVAISRGIEVMDAVAESLPYKDLKFDFVLMSFCISYFKELHSPFKEAHRVLKNNGALVIGFLDKNSVIGRAYAEHQADSIFYKHAKFYSVNKVVSELTQAGFRNITIAQTLFDPLDKIKTFQPSRKGYGEGSFVVLKALK